MSKAHRSMNHLVTLEAHAETGEMLQRIRLSIKPYGLNIKWYKNKNSYSVYIRPAYVRKSTPVVDIQSKIESTFTPEQTDFPSGMFTLEPVTA